MTLVDDTAGRDRLAARLGVPADTLSGPVLHRIATDPLFLHHLEACAGEPRLLRILLREAETTTVAPAPAPAPAPAAGAETVGDAGAADRSTTELVRRAATAFGRWAGSGFRLVDDDVQERRSASCASCPHLIGPGASIVYTIGRVPADRRSVCGLCGCDVRRKVRLASESCPAHRWGPVEPDPD